MNTILEKSIRLLKEEVLGAELALLRSGGNEISADHKEALYAITSLFVDSAYSESESPSRYAIGLDTGLGKTTLLATYLNTLKAKGIRYPVLVCVPNLKAMQEFRQALIDGSFTPDEVGCKFSGNALPFQSVGEDVDAYDVLITCHARVDSSREDWNKLVSYRTVFYDEALKRGTVIEGIHLNLKSDVQTLEDFLPEVLREQLLNLLAALKEADTDEIIPLSFPDAAADMVSRAIKEHHRATRREQKFNELESVVSGKYDALRNHSGNYFTFESTLPNMNNLFILDANHAFSELSKLDESIQVLELPKFKRFDDVTFKAASMSLSKTKIMANPDRYVQWANDLSSDEAAIICFKAMANRFPADKCITWGMHAGANSFSPLNTLVCVGLLTKPHAITKGDMALVQDSLSASIDGYQQINADEALLNLYQAVSRGASRKVFVKDGITYACPSTIYLSGQLTQPQVELLKAVMPGCKYSLMEYEQPVSDIKQYFEGVQSYPLIGKTASIAELRKNIPSLAALTKSGLAAVISQLLQEGFTKHGRSLTTKPL